MAAILRDARDSDWPAILELANESVADVPGAGSQDAWVTNRRSFDASSGVQRHWVAEEEPVVVGYSAVESRAKDNPKSFRIFVVTDPKRRASLGRRLLENALAELKRQGAKSAWFAEYALDTEFIGFLKHYGFAEQERFESDDGSEVFELKDGAEVIVLSKSLSH
jgi:N-acetylglutamate synthase-like GNAT family acetyltransferase